MAIRGKRFIIEGTVYCGARCRNVGENSVRVPALACRAYRHEYFHPVTGLPYIMHNDPRVPEELRR